MNTTKYRKALKAAHNELREELDSAESEAERAYIRGKRAGILQAIAEFTEHDEKTDFYPITAELEDEPLGANSLQNNFPSTTDSMGLRATDFNNEDGEDQPQ